MYYTLWPAPGHVHPKLRLKEKPSLISLAGGVEGLAVTDPAARAKPLDPAGWKEMLRAADDVNAKVAAGQEDAVSWGVVMLGVRGCAQPLWLECCRWLLGRNLALLRPARAAIGHAGCLLCRLNRSIAWH